VIDRSKLFPQHPRDVRKTSQTDDVCRRCPEAGCVALHPASARFLNELINLFFLKPAGSSGGFLFFPQ
jgi:hypothetical protein